MAAGSLIQGTAIAHRAITPTVATGLTAADLIDSAGRPADAVLVTVETQPVRFRFDGTDPQAATGHTLAAGDERVFRGVNILRNIKFIDTAAGASTVRYTTMWSKG